MTSGRISTDSDHHELNSSPAQTYERKLDSHFPSANHWPEYQSKPNSIMHITIVMASSTQLHPLLLRPIWHRTAKHNIHCVSEKMRHFYTCDNFVRCHPILPILGRNTPPGNLEQTHNTTNQTSFLQHVSIACYAKRCISYRKSVRLSVCHTLALCQNDSSYDHGVFTGA